MKGSDIKIVESEKEFSDVFLVQKKVFEEEQDINSDQSLEQEFTKADHVVVYIDEQPIGSARVRYLNKNNGLAEIDRIAVLKEYRKLGIGKLIMEYLHNFLGEKGIIEIMLKPQEHARKFYEDLGYVQSGEAFGVKGTPHIEMRKKVGQLLPNEEQLI